MIENELKPHTFSRNNAVITNLTNPELKMKYKSITGEFFRLNLYKMIVAPLAYNP